jgi:hypothetical protein
MEFNILLNGTYNNIYIISSISFISRRPISRM